MSEIPTDLLSMKEVAQRLSWPVENQSRVHTFIKRHGIPKYREGKRTFVSWADVREAYHKPIPTLSSKFVDSIPDEYAGVLLPFEQRPELVLWDRGKYQGWAVAAIEDTDSRTITMATSYGKKYFWEKKSMGDAIANGEMFFNEPQEVLHFIVAQLLRKIDAPGVKETIRKIHEAAIALEHLKETIEAQEAKADE